MKICAIQHRPVAGDIAANLARHSELIELAIAQSADLVFFPEPELGRLIVSPRHRRQGLARLLIARLASIAHEAGARQIWMRVLPTNAAAIRCYESAGFTRVPEEQQAALNAAH